MNRREILKGAAAVSIAALSAGRIGSLTAESSASGTPSRNSSASGLKVLFYGLWAFWYGQPSPADGKTEGILAFSPDVTGTTAHVYTADFKNTSKKQTLKPGVQYRIAPDVQSTQTQNGLWNAASAHNAGMFLRTSSGGTLVVTPLPADQMRQKNARTIWLPYPDDIIPVANVDLHAQTLFDKNSSDLGNADLKQYWPVIQAFIYSNCTSFALTDGISTITAPANLHVRTRPDPTPHDKGKHAGMAWNALVALVPRQNGKSLDIALGYPLAEEMGACSNGLDGVDEGDDIPHPCSKKAGTSRILSPSAEIRLHIESNPSNCAVGCGVQIGP